MNLIVIVPVSLVFGIGIAQQYFRWRVFLLCTQDFRMIELTFYIREFESSLLAEDYLLSRYFEHILIRNTCASYEVTER